MGLFRCNESCTQMRVKTYVYGLDESVSGASLRTAACSTRTVGHSVRGRFIFCSYFITLLGFKEDGSEEVNRK